MVMQEITRITPFATAARRLFGLDVGDWSIVLLGIALAASLLLALA
jgi:hypothetical protein